MDPSTQNMSSDVWYECDSLPYVEQVSAYVARQVSAEMFRISTQQQYQTNLEYSQYREIHRSVFTSARSRNPPWGIPSQPLSTHPPHFCGRGASATTPTEEIDALLPHWVDFAARAIFRIH